MTKWFGFLVIIIVGLALILPLALVSREYRSSGGWYPALIAYVVMGLPILAYFPQTTFIFNFIVVLARVGGIAGGALVPGAYFPFCQLKGKPFGITYLVVGCIGGFLATCGMFYFWGRALRERPAAQEAELPQIRGRRFVFQ
jgi:CDP-diglyceride synthetase